jgi:hypothetical protein
MNPLTNRPDSDTKPQVSPTPDDRSNRNLQSAHTEWSEQQSQTYETAWRAWRDLARNIQAAVTEHAKEQGESRHNIETAVKKQARHAQGDSPAQVRPASTRASSASPRSSGGLVVVSQDVGSTASSKVSCCGIVSSGFGGWSNTMR